jgi:hypothetical protein
MLPEQPADDCKIRRAGDIHEHGVRTLSEAFG